MISKEEFRAFVGQIVADTMPAEHEAFELASPLLTESLFEGRGPDTGASQSGEFQFLDSSTDVLNFVGLMIGTFETIRRFATSFEKKAPPAAPPTHQVVLEWQRQLRIAGVPETVASDIAARFGEQLLAAGMKA